VKIAVPPQQYKMHEEIRAKVENIGNSAALSALSSGKHL